MALIGCGVALAVLFLINESIVARPWAHAEVLFSRNIGLSLVAILLYPLTSLSNSSLIPNFIINVAQLRPIEMSRVFLLYATVPIVALVPVVIYLVRHYDVRWTLITGFAAFAAAALLGTRLTSVWANENVVPILLIQALGQAFTLLPIIIVALSNSDPSRATAFAAYIQVMRLGGAEIGIALMSTWLRIREQVHSNLLGLHVASGDADVAGILAKLNALLAAWRGAGARPQHRQFGKLSATAGKHAGIYRWLLADLLAGRCGTDLC